MIWFIVHLSIMPSMISEIHLWNWCDLSSVLLRKIERNFKGLFSFMLACVKRITPDERHSKHDQTLILSKQLQVLPMHIKGSHVTWRSSRLRCSPHRWIDVSHQLQLTENSGMTDEIQAGGVWLLLLWVFVTRVDKFQPSEKQHGKLVTPCWVC